MIYLDHHATTPCDPLVVEAMLPFFNVCFANPSSSHALGQDASDAVELARTKVAGLIGALPSEIIFTSGATESNNLAILGAASAYRQKGGTRKCLVTSPIEHKSVIAPLEALAKQDSWELVYLNVDMHGSVDIEHAAQIINEETFLVSVQYANSEIGTIQQIERLSELAASKGSLFHTDASQAVGNVGINLNPLNIHLLSLSGHKFYGPKGIGALWVRQGLENLIQPSMYGGGQGKGLRPGTLPVPLIVGLGKACDIAMQSIGQEWTVISELRDDFERQLSELIPGIKRNGDIMNRLPNNSNLLFPEVDAEALLANVPEVVASTGSACESGSLSPSRVLLEIGLTDEEAYSSVRFGLGRFTTQEEINEAVVRLQNAFGKF